MTGLPDATVLLRLAGLRKRYGDRQVLDGLSFEVRRGEVFGLLGPNGCGKSTAIHVIAGLLAADGGEVTIDGRAPGAATRRRVGLCPQDIALYRDLSARENLEFFGRLHGLGGAALRAGVDALVERFALAPVAAQRLATFVRRLAAARQHRRRAGARPRTADPRRTDLGGRPAGPARTVGPDRRPRSRGRDAAADDAPPRRGRAPVRAGRDRARRPRAACRHGGRAAGGGAGACGRVHRVEGPPGRAPARRRARLAAAAVRRGWRVLPAARAAVADRGAARVRGRAGLGGRGAAGAARACLSRAAG